MQGKIGLIFFLLVLIINVAAQLLEKRGMISVGGIHSFNQLFSISVIGKLATNPYVVSGVALSALSLVLYLGALSTLKLSYLAPMAGVTYVIIALISWLFLNEPISVLHWAGIVVIAVGVFLVNY